MPITSHRTPEWFSASVFLLVGEGARGRVLLMLMRDNEEWQRTLAAGIVRDAMLQAIDVRLSRSWVEWLGSRPRTARVLRFPSRPLFGVQTLWNSTARFHVSPRPYKSAVVSNIPAFMAGALLR
jgi:hypothetical protein